MQAPPPLQKESNEDKNSGMLCNLESAKTRYLIFSMKIHHLRSSALISTIISFDAIKWVRKKI